MHTSPLAIAASVTAAVIVFILDRLPREGTAVELLYILPVIMIALWSAPRDIALVVGVAAASTVLSLTDFPVATLTEPHCSGVISHLLVIGAIWLTAALSVLRKRKERTTQWIGLSPANS